MERLRDFLKVTQLVFFQSSFFLITFFIPKSATCSASDLIPLLQNQSAVLTVVTFWQPSVPVGACMHY